MFISRCAPLSLKRCVPPFLVNTWLDDFQPHIRWASFCMRNMITVHELNQPRVCQHDQHQVQAVMVVSVVVKTLNGTLKLPTRKN